MAPPNDFPPFRMLIKDGKLEPRTPADAERLDSFGNNKEVMCYFTQEPPRTKQKQWYAVLRLVVKQCKTVWRSEAEASDAIKLALGHADTFRTVAGEWRQTPKSLNDLDDAGMRELFDDMVVLMTKMTGVDPLTLKSESKSAEVQDGIDDSPPHEDNPQDIAEQTSAGDEGESSEEKTESEPEETGTDPKSPEDGADEGDEPDGDGDSSQPSPSPPLKKGEYTFKTYAARLFHTVSVCVAMDGFKPYNETEVKEAMAPLSHEQQDAFIENRGGKKFSKKEVALIGEIHKLCGACLMGNRQVGTTRAAMALAIEKHLGTECDPDELIWRDN